MGRRELSSGNFSSTPVVRLTDKVGCKFIGIIKENSASKFGLIFKFTILDGDAPIKTKDASGNLVEAAVKPNDDVVVFASGQLKDKLLMAQVGEKIEIEYKGKKVNPKSGRAFNDYCVAVVD